jgi:hypothetical protein
MKILLLSDLILGHYLEYVHHKYMEVWEKADYSLLSKIYSIKKYHYAEKNN